MVDRMIVPLAVYYMAVTLSLVSADCSSHTLQVSGAKNDDIQGDYYKRSAVCNDRDIYTKTSGGQLYLYFVGYSYDGDDVDGSDTGWYIGTQPCTFKSGTRAKSATTYYDPTLTSGTWSELMYSTWEPNADLTIICKDDGLSTGLIITLSLLGSLGLLLLLLTPLIWLKCALRKYDRPEHRRGSERDRYRNQRRQPVHPAHHLHVAPPPYSVAVVSRPFDDLDFYPPGDPPPPYEDILDVSMETSPARSIHTRETTLHIREILNPVGSNPTCEMPEGLGTAVVRTTLQTRCNNRASWASNPVDSLASGQGSSLDGQCSPENTEHINSTGGDGPAIAPSAVMHNNTTTPANQTTETQTNPIYVTAGEFVQQPIQSAEGCGYENQAYQGLDECVMEEVRRGYRQPRRVGQTSQEPARGASCSPW